MPKFIKDLFCYFNFHLEIENKEYYINISGTQVYETNCKNCGCCISEQRFQ